MSGEVRFQKRAAGPEFLAEDELVVWAADDGTLRTTDENGDEVSLGAGGPGGSVSVTDGSTTVDPASALSFTGATVSDEGGGVAGVAVQGGSPPISSPLDLTGCVLWLDASDATTINAGSPSDDDPVSAWADKSTSGYDFAQATANNKPVYKTAFQNGLGVVQFDASVTSRFLDAATAGDLFRNLPGASLFFVARGIFSSFVLFASINGDATVPRFAYSGNGFFTQPLDAGTSYNTDDAGNMIYGFSAVAAIANFAAGGMRVGDTGLLGADPIGAAPSPPASDDTASTLVRIGDDGGDTGPMTGDLAELIVYERPVNLLERREVLEYLSVKWNSL